MIGLLWAVHVADGVLGWPVLLGGFVGMAILTWIASWRVREDEIPRIALLTAAFFVASSIHVRLGPTSVHLLLNGLVGVLLGWRAPLAILIGIGLQAVLIAHGGLTTIGVNALVETIPAILVGVLFPYLLSLHRGTYTRGALVGLSAMLWGSLVVFGVALLWTNPWRETFRFSSSAGIVVSIENLQPVLDLAASPWVMLGLLAFAAVCIVWDVRRATSAEFSAGVFVGAFAVLLTTMLTGLALVVDGAEKWSQFATAVFVAHLPLALLEGLIVGVMVSYLARVKPELLHVSKPSLQTAVVAGVILLIVTSSAHAHNLEAEAKIDRSTKQITIQSRYESGDPPSSATARVYRFDGSLVREGALDDQGVFRFSYETIEPLRVEIRAPGGHRVTLLFSESDLSTASPGFSGEALERSRGRDLLLGLTFLLALAAFVLSWRTSKRVAQLLQPPSETR